MQKKTRFMQFNGVPISVMLNNTKISRIGTNENEKSFNLLGIEIDDKLQWSDHIQKIINKISKGTYMLYKFKKLLPTKTKTLLYNSFVMSHLRYGITIWGKARNIFYGKLCTINKKACDAFNQKNDSSHIYDNNVKIKISIQKCFQ